MAGRPLQFDRRAALHVAMLEFWRRGYPNVTVNGLSEKLGIKRSSFYHSFGSLDELFDEAVALYMSAAPAARTSVQGSETAKRSPTAQIRDAVRYLCKIRANDADRKGCLIVNSLGVFDSLPDSAKETIQRALEAGAEPMRELIILAKSTGELDTNSDVETVHNALQALMLGLNSLARVEGDEDKLWAVADATLSGLGLTGPDR